MTARRISFVCPSAQALGGVQSWLGYLAPALALNGWHVKVHLPQGRFSSAAALAAAQGLEAFAIPFENPTGSREGRVHALAESLRRAQPDLILGVNLVDVYASVARLRNEGSAARLAIGLHGLHSCLYEDLRRWSAIVDGAISPSRLGTRAASELAGLPPERVFYAQCGIEVAPLPPSEPRHSRDVLRLVYVGRFEEAEKRVRDLPRIAAELDRMGIPFELVLAGQGPEEGLLRRELARFGACVRFVGWVPAEQLAREAYRPGSILLVTSPSETGPLAAWEAMARGVVVVTSEFLGLRAEGALVPSVNCLSFPLGDARAAAERIALLRDETTFRRLADAAWSTVATQYTRDASIRAWSAALSAIVAKPARGTCDAGDAIPAAGRLDRWLGVERADAARRWLGIEHRHADAGAEWPHTYTPMEAGGAVDPRLAALDLGMGT